MKYFDTSYLVRLYFQDAGWERVRAEAATAQLACSVYGQAECIAAFHRKFREGAVTHRALTEILEQFQYDCSEGAIRWLPLSPGVISRLTQIYRHLPRQAALRSGDALHLASATENTFPEIYANDQRLLQAAPHFALEGKNVI